MKDFLIQHWDKIITIAISALAFGLAFWQFRKSSKNTKENKQLQEKNLRLQQQLLELEKKRDHDAAQVQEQQEKQAIQQTQDRLSCYLQFIHDQFQYLDFTGLNAILQKPLKLEKIYIKLRAKRSYQQEYYHSIEDFSQLEKEIKKTEEEATASLDFVQLFEELLKQKDEPVRMVILGQPGSGKTTLLKWIALQTTLKTEELFQPFCPVFIPLKDLGRSPEETFRSHNILETARYLLGNQTDTVSILEEQFQQNKLLFLLDGLDEVADKDLRRDVISWIQKQDVRQNPLIVTSRFSGLQPSQGLQFPQSFMSFAIQDFTQKDIEAFLGHWYQNVEEAIDQERETQKAAQEGRERSQDLIQILQEQGHTRLRELAVNPLLLTIIAIVHRTRAILPKERHKLYEEALKVMVELWNISNRKLKVTFSIENSLANLAIIAKYLMEHNRREITLPEIQELLPATIEEKSLTFFIEEMTVKAGLLYRSEGKFGFLHLTFQEYLTAYFFARSSNQNQILQYREQDYWQETFRLIVNIGNAHTLFQEIIELLVEKQYWTQMNLWEELLREIVEEKTKFDLEKKFAIRVLEILPNLGETEEEEAMINQLYLHYPLYRHASFWEKIAWQLRQSARHGFVKTVAASILNRCDTKAHAEITKDLKQQIETLQKKSHLTLEEERQFFWENENSFVILLSQQRKNEFSWILHMLRTGPPIIQFMILRDLLVLLDLRSLRYLLDLRDLRDLLDLLDLRYLRYLRDLLDLRYLRSLLDLRYLRDLRNNLKAFEGRKTKLEEHRPAIEAWAEKALEKLDCLSPAEVKRYFPLDDSNSA